MSVSAKAKGSAYERQLARQLGVKRTPLSGADGGNDLMIPDGHLLDPWGIEAKRRKKLPASIVSWLAQAEYALPVGSMRKPAVIMREDRGRSIFVAYLDDVMAWATALADTGSGKRHRDLARQLERIAAELKDGR